MDRYTDRPVTPPSPASQGYTRPKVLLLAPTRRVALDLVRSMEKLLGPHVKVRCALVLCVGVGLRMSSVRVDPYFAAPYVLDV